MTNSNSPVPRPVQFSLGLLFAVMGVVALTLTVGRTWGFMPAVQSLVVGVHGSVMVGFAVTPLPWNSARRELFGAGCLILLPLAPFACLHVLAWCVRVPVGPPDNAVTLLALALAGLIQLLMPVAVWCWWHASKLIDEALADEPGLRAAFRGEMPLLFLGMLLFWCGTCLPIP